MGMMASAPKCLHVHTYDELRGFASALAARKYDFLIVLGSGGVGKTQIFERELRNIHGNNGFGHIKGKSTPLALYETAYRNFNRPLLLDDLDNLFQDQECVKILKQLCDTREVRHIEWNSTHHAFTRQDNPLPRHFDSVSQTCIITNDLGRITKNLDALFNRGPIILFEPNVLEVHREVGRAGWFDDEEVFDFIGEHLFLIGQPSCRLYDEIREHKHASPNWRDIALRTFEDRIDPKLLLVIRLMADPTFDRHGASEAARVEAFQNQGGGSRATYHRKKREALQLQGKFNMKDVRSIRLQPLRPSPYDLEQQRRREELMQMEHYDGRTEEYKDEILEPAPVESPLNEGREVVREPLQARVYHVLTDLLSQIRQTFEEGIGDDVCEADQPYDRVSDLRTQLLEAIDDDDFVGAASVIGQMSQGGERSALLRDLPLLLKEASDAERYEIAGLIRDEIDRLESEGEAPE